MCTRGSNRTPTRGPSTSPLGDMLRILVLMLISLPVLAAAPELTDIDVSDITTAASELLTGPFSSISAASFPCGSTAESGCTAEVQVVAEGSRTLTVSKIDGVWKVGRWQREIIAFTRCIEALSKSRERQAALGKPMDADTYRKRHRECYGSSGRVGDTRGL